MAGAARIVYVGHSTVLVELDGVRVLTDPLLRPRLLHLRRSTAVRQDPLSSIDAVLVSHAHFDHLDFRSLRMLPRDVRVVVPRGAGRLVRRRGFTEVTEVGVGEQLRLGSLVVNATQAVHDARRRPLGIRAEPVGYALRGSRTVYFAGDTDVFDGMSEIGPVDVALLPIWGWGPTIGAGHMSPREAAQAARLLQAEIAIPIHWGTYFPWHTALRRLPAFVQAPAAEFAARLEEIAPEVALRVLEPGEETVV